MEKINQPKGIKPKMRGRKVRSGVHWQGALEPKGVKEAHVNRPCYIYGEGDHTPPCNAKVQNECISLSTLTIYIFVFVCV